MELQQLKYFKTVADVGKISEAAERLFISTPALSTSISRLEKELGVKLFDRTSNRLFLNEQGRIFLKYTKQVFLALESAKQEVAQSALHQGRHISLVNTNSRMWDNLIAAFTAEFSDYTLSCSTISAAGLASVKYDFLMAYEGELSPAYAEKLDSIFLFQATPTVMVHKDHPLAQKDAVELEDVITERFFLPAPGVFLYTRLQQLFKLHKITVPTDNFYSYMVRQKMVVANKGISFVSQHPAVSSHPDIRHIPLVDPFEPWTARLYWRKGRTLTESEIIFRDFVEIFYRDMH